MLKALELVGFKSFADKTRFEFPKGITAVVGPNGSGKSNVVDAIKWVLGEQSIKSLRGKEMTDVIFNGSGARTPLNAAEATLTFDNSQRRLPIDAPELQVTRRVYRSGEGEYLINRQPCRLRDIRDLISGTGVATEAYGVIEQGKVDIMLQASPRDRRAIFEEAAGISRFKAKKLESLRRLERVEQNLLRLSDIVDEVDNRLRGVRAQASKARRFRDQSDRLQALRTQVGLSDWRKLTEKLTRLEDERQMLAAQRDTAASGAEVHESRALELETLLGEIHETIRTSEARLAEGRERIATLEAALQHQLSRARDADEEFARGTRQLAAMCVRAGDLEQQFAETSAAAAQAGRRYADDVARLADCERALANRIEEIEALRGEHEAGRTAALAATSAATALETEAAALEARLATEREARDRAGRRIAELDRARTVLTDELEPLQRAQQDLLTTLDERERQWSAAQARATELRRRHAVRQGELAQWRQRHAGTSERATVLEELQQRQEGLGSGVKEVLAQVRGAAAGPFRHVRGLLADLFHVKVEMAPLIEAALGERAQHLVVDDDAELLAYLERETYRFAGRVGFLRMRGARASGWEHMPDLEGRLGVVGRADQFVDTAAALAPLAQHLLGRTWIVEKLSHALALADGDGRGLTFVTLAGELLAADGTVSVGPRQGSSGLISRRSELRALKQQLAEWTATIEAATEAVTSLEREITAESQRAEDLAAEKQRAADGLGEHRLRLRAAEARLAQLIEGRAALEQELAASCERFESHARELAACHERSAEAADHLTEARAAAAALASRWSQADGRRRNAERELTSIKVEAAKSEERLNHLRERLRQLERDQRERRRSLADCRAQLDAARRRSQEAELLALGAESQLAELYLRKETLAAATCADFERLEAHRAQRAERTTQAQTHRADARTLDERLHAHDLAANEVRHERSALADRLREDYQIELANLEHLPSEDELHERERLDREIAELRRRLGHLGNVNLDALEELDVLEARYATLKAQFDDLTRAKDSLAQIIGKINADSRRLFAETLETVKGHFQGLFRKLFGGGHADIVLEEGVDILDSGIEIVARPPGKEPRNISLLSGGEKTLTCVALLLAIFQYRPSPFCVLDEVDAALDEANIERFVAVLKEFLAWTQFIVVTHSKKTMTCATTLYGVTMEESGVSKRVSVRFQDVSDDGEIRPTKDGEAGEQAA
ncbi:MAG TPA: chromosome segregation protein SMC [Pirellulales bacterium]|nr:chromosome segregation protein SMC [Pirellulales bacterium]